MVRKARWLVESFRHRLRMLLLRRCRDGHSAVIASTGTALTSDSVSAESPGVFVGGIATLSDGHFGFGFHRLLVRHVRRVSDIGVHHRHTARLSCNRSSRTSECRHRRIRGCTPHSVCTPDLHVCRRNSERRSQKLSTAGKLASWVRIWLTSCRCGDSEWSVRPRRACPPVVHSPGGGLPPRPDCHTIRIRRVRGDGTDPALLGE